MPYTWVNPKKQIQERTERENAQIKRERQRQEQIAMGKRQGWVNPNLYTAQERHDRWLESQGLLNYQRRGSQGGGAGVVDAHLVPAGGHADRPTNFIQATDPVTGKAIVAQPSTKTTNANSPYASLVFAKPDDVVSGTANWADLSTADRQKILRDPNFYKGEIAKYSFANQQAILADPNFQWDNLKIKTPFGDINPQQWYHSASSNPTIGPYIQPVTIAALQAAQAGGGVIGAAKAAVLAAGAVASGYDINKEWWKQGDNKFTWDKAQFGDALRGAFGVLQWGGEQIEKAGGLALQGAEIALGNDPNFDPNKRNLDVSFNKDFSLIPGENFNPELLTGSAWNAGALTYETLAPAIQSALKDNYTPAGIREKIKNKDFNIGDALMLVPPAYVLGRVMDVVVNPEKYKGNEIYIGSSVPVKLDQTWLERIYQAREEIKSGKSYREVSVEMQAGLLAQAGDMYGQIKADPLNVVGDVEVVAGEKIAKVTGNPIMAEAFRQSGWGESPGAMDAIKRFKNIINTPGEAFKIDPNYKVSELGAMSKYMAGLAKDGTVKATGWTNQGLLDYTKPKNNLLGFIDYLRTQNPESRARVGQDLLISNVGRIMASYFNGTDVEGFGNWWKAFSQGDMTQAADLSNAMAQAPEFYTVLPAAKNFDMDAALSKWTATDTARQSVTRIADILGENPMSMVEDMVKRGTAEQDFTRLQERLTQVDTPEARALLKEITDGRFTPEILQDTVKLFADGDVPYHPGQWMAQTLSDIQDHYDNWAVDHFRLDDESKKTLFRMSAVMKSAQSVLLLGANPGYFISNVLPTMVTRAMTGVWGYMTPTAIDTFLTRMGFDPEAGLMPNRLDEGVGPGGVVDQARAQGDVIREATRGKNIFTKIENAIGQVGRNMPFNKLSRLLEGYEGKQAYLIGMKKFWGEGWRRESGFRALPAELLPELERVAGPRAKEILYSQIEAGMNQQEIANIVSSATQNVQSRALLNEAATRLNVPSSKAAAMLEQAGVFDALDANLKGATTQEKVYAAFERAKKTAKMAHDQQAARDAIANIEHVANRVSTEGMKAVTDIIIETENAGIDNWMQHLERMGNVAEAVESLDNPNTRSSLWSLNYAESSAERQRFNAHKSSVYLGILKALGQDMNPTARALLSNIAEVDTALDGAYRTMRELRDEHFKKWNSDWENPRRQTERTSVERRVEEAWKKATQTELANSKQFGELLAKQYESAFGVEAGEAARQAWEQITAFRKEMTDRRDSFRKGIEGLPAAERQIQSQKFWGETYKYMIVEMQKIKTEAIRKLDNIVNRRPGDGTATPAPTEPTPPTQPPAAPAVDEMARLREDAQKRQALTDERVNQMWAAAEPFGFNNNEKYKLVTSLNKYGDFQVETYTDERLTPDYVKEVLTRRETVKAEQQAIKERNAADSAVNQIHKDAIEKPRSELPETISTAMEYEARRIADVVAGGEPGKRLFADGEFIDLQSSAGGRQGLLKALSKIIEDAGKDKGVVVARVKEFLLGNLKYGDSHTNQPPNLVVLRDLGMDDVALQHAANEFNTTMGTNFSVEQMLGNDYTSAFDTYYNDHLHAADAFDPARWEADLLDAADNMDMAKLNDLYEQMPETTWDEQANVTGDTWRDLYNRTFDETQDRARTTEQQAAIADRTSTAEQAVKDMQTEATTGFTRAQFRESLTDVFGLTDEMADAVMDITDARANAYGDVNEWYRTRIADVQKAGEIDLAQEAFHGSPYKFDKFTLDKIGSGEGAQAYGWGLYFAGAEKVADWYRETLSKTTSTGQSTRQFKVDGVLTKLGEYQSRSPYNEATLGKLDDYIKVWEKWTEEHPGNEAAAKLAERNLAEARALIGKKVEAVDNAGQLYKVEIPDDGYLLWDRPLSEQPENVQNILRETRMGGLRVNLGGDGSSIYKMLSDRLGSDKAASLALKEAGINGIKYLDGSSRGKGEGNYNYVVFDDNAIKILETYYQNGEGIRNPKAGVRFMEDGRAIIRAWEGKADVSSVAHELGHIFRRDLQGADLKVIEDWAGVKDGNWERAHEEQFARGFERYLADGSAPTPRLRTVFEKFKNWMVSIYRAITGSPIDVELTPQVKEVFDRLLTGEQTRNVDYHDMLLQMGYDPKAYYFDPQGNIRRRPDFKINVNRDVVARDADAVMSSDFARRLSEMKNGSPLGEEVNGAISPRNEPVYKLSYEEFKATIFADQKARAEAMLDKIGQVERGELSPDAIPELSRDKLVKTRSDVDEVTRYKSVPVTLEDVRAKYTELRDRNTLSRELYGDVKQKYMQAMSKALVSELPVSDDIKQAYYAMKKTSGQRMQGAGVAELFQDADPRMPMGGYEEAAGWMPQSQAMDELWSQEIAPLLDGMRDVAVERLNQPSMNGVYSQLSPEAQKKLNQYLKGVQTDMASTKMAAQRWGQDRRDYAMLNYNKRTGLDQYADVLFPYQFFYTRSMMTWAMRALDNPAILSNYARLRRQQDRYENNLPERLRGKMRIEAPWLPDWMGDALYIDPLSVLFTPHNFLRPMEQMVKDNNMQYIEADRVLQEWAADGTIPQQQIVDAAKNRSGTVWERALAEAKMRREAQISNPMDFVSATFGPAWYLSTPAKMLGIGKDGPETLTELPLTRTARAFETVTQNTWAEPIGNLIGLLAKPEEKFREANNLPQFGEYGDYYIDRQLANMVAEGKITSEQAQIAMIERKGELFNQAQERVKMELAMRVPLMGAIYAGTHGENAWDGMWQAAKALPPSLFGAGVLPSGELEYRGLKQEWNDAWKLKDAGDEQAITRFFEEHPEYEAYLAKGKEPDERLRSFLVGQIWDGYMALGDTDRRTAGADLGQEFKDAFLNKETRSYDTIPVETLAQWAQMLHKNIPTVPQTLPAIQNPQQINFMDPSVTRITDEYYAQRKQYHPNYYELEQAYYSKPKSERHTYLIEHPDLKEYWDWKRKWYNRFPELVPVFKGDVFDRVDTSTWNPMLVEYVADYAYSGTPLPTGAYKALQQVWINEGRPRGDMQEWLKNDVAPSMLYSQ